MNKNTLHERIGVGAVLYDTREPKQRTCCCEGGRCLWHVTNVYESVVDGDTLYDVCCGTHTSQEYIHGEDLGWMFDPAGWQWPVGRKPTYHLTRTVGVHDNHDLMLEANR